MKCFKCGTLINSDTKNCPNCGQNLRKIKKGFSPNMYNKIKSVSSNKSQKSIPMDISIGDSISEQYIIHEYLNDDLIFYSFIGIDSFNKQKVQIDFIKPTLLKTEYDKSQFINSLREEKFRQHENLTIIYDYGKHNNYYYIVSEHIEGITLREIIDTKQENFTLEEIEPIIAQITDALTEIHEDSLVAYLIPENIIIMKNILKIRNTFWFRCFNHKTVLKYFSSDAPSYHYLAPELRGGSPKLINATDLYSIGVILSSLLVGKIYKGVPFNLSEYNNALPVDIDMLFLKLIHKNANKRFQNVEDFLIFFDKLFSFTPIDHDETTRVVNTSDILSIEEENFDFEDEMETSMIDRTHAQNVVTKFDDDEPETTVMPKKETFEADEPETTVMPKKKKETVKTKTSPSQEPKKKKVPEKQEEKKKKDSNTSFNSYKNPFYQPEEIKKEQEVFQQQKEFQEYQKSVYQQLSDFQERDNKKNLLMIIGFFAFALIIVVLILVMFLRPGNTISSNDAKLMATIKKQNEMIDNMNKKFDVLEKQKQKSKEEVLLAKKEREKKENELIEQEKKIKALDDKKIEKSNEEEKKKLEEEKKNAELKKEKLQKELEAKKKKEEEKKKKQKELREKLQKEQKILAQKKKEAQKKKAQQAKLIKNKNLSKKLEEAKKKEALRLAKKKNAEKLAKKKKEAQKLARKKEQERLAKRKEEKKKLEQAKKKKDLDAEADALLASAMEENKKEAVVKKDGKCPKGMIKIKAGSFKYGSSASDPTRGPSDPLLKTVSLNTYCIDRYESKGPISFTQAEVRCKKRKKRICTTQEWEKACKGRYNRKFPYGNKFNANKCNTADADGESRKYKRTGSFKKCRSPYGLYDMSGNLAEWTKSGNSSRQILKGGSYKSEDFDSKCSSVKKASKGSRRANYGYRCCSNLE